jgi:hypothetical protein
MRPLKPRKKRPLPPIDTACPLRRTLLRHGFEAAARGLGWVDDPAARARRWEDYPACLDGFPAQLSRPGQWWQERGWEPK